MPWVYKLSEPPPTQRTGKQHSDQETTGQHPRSPSLCAPFKFLTCPRVTNPDLTAQTHFAHFCNVNGIIHYVLFFIWLISFDIMLLKPPLMLHAHSCNCPFSVHIICHWRNTTQFVHSLYCWWVVHSLQLIKNCAAMIWTFKCMSFSQYMCMSIASIYTFTKRVQELWLPHILANFAFFFLFHFSHSGSCVTVLPKYFINIFYSLYFVCF